MDQKDRVYALTIGDYKSGLGVRIEELQIKFEVTKSSDNKRRPAGATVEVYNLSPSTLHLLDSNFIQCTLEVGYKLIGKQTILQGNVVEIKTVQHGNDKVTQLLLGEGYVELNNQIVKKVIPAGSTKEAVLEAIRDSMPGVSRGAYTGFNLNSPILYGYPLNGTPKELLDTFAESNNMEWRVNNGSLYANDINGLVSKSKSLAPLISKETGLIDIPFRTTEKGKKLPGDKTRKKGVQFKALLNPNIVPGQIVYLKSEDIKGWFRVNDIRYTGDYRGNDWYIECFCSLIDDEELL
ncbi:hypothetical protein [Pseudomonas helleri]|uniref:hypothetical protein n=1 Tax=Pseudomonas helleri TaxID=1608996 RepID=UPI002431E8FC|nr:hypothetical protein [Pseudomonas helleri]